MKWVNQTMCNKNRSIIKNKEVKNLKDFMYVCCTLQLPLQSRNWNSRQTYILKNMTCCRQSYVLRIYAAGNPMS